ncbi:MAG: cyclase family protein [Microscillaceae bacterium]|jgi:kynurenine formamidase|nr:cyclase family protein [Microscillaceae bacterium]
MFTCLYQNQAYSFNPNEALDISLPLQAGENNPNCYFAEVPQFETIRAANFVGSVAEGGTVNYQKISLTPHGNGTHTESYGHISADPEATIYQCLQKFLFIAELISLSPKKIGGDEVILLEDIKNQIKTQPEALIIRTLPNTDAKKTRQYSQSNPPYLAEGAGQYLASQSIQHLLIDLPSVDKEIDGGRLHNHRGFWQFSDNIRKNCTISELVYIDNQIEDGLYLLNLQIVSLMIDASPSKPVLYKLKKV